MNLGQISLLLISLNISFSLPLLGSGPSNHPAYDAIIKIRPNINKSYAMTLSNKIHKYSIKFGIDKMLMVAIIAQESMFKMGVVGYGGDDYGLTQINITNIRVLKLDMNRLMTDVDYSVWAGFRIMSEFLRFEREEPYTFWSRYNTGNSERLRHVRKKYEKRVCRFYHGSKYCGAHNNER